MRHPPAAAAFALDLPRRHVRSAQQRADILARCRAGGWRCRPRTSPGGRPADHGTGGACTGLRHVRPRSDGPCHPARRRIRPRRPGRPRRWGAPWRATGPAMRISTRSPLLPAQRQVHPAQIVDVDQHQRADRAVQIEPVDVAVGLVQEPAPVGQAGQPVDADLPHAAADRRPAAAWPLMRPDRDRRRSRAAPAAPATAPGRRGGSAASTHGTGQHRTLVRRDEVGRAGLGSRAAAPARGRWCPRPATPRQ